MHSRDIINFPPPANSNHPGFLSRRQFIANLIGAGAVLVGSPLVLAGCEKKDELAELINSSRAYAPHADIQYLDVGDEQVLSSINCEEAEPGDYLREQASYDLPVGCQMHQDCESFAVLLQSNTGRVSSLVSVYSFDLQSGSKNKLIETPISEPENYTIYDARANENIIIWVECQFTSGNWRVYAATITGENHSDMGEAKLLDSGEALWEPPMLCVCERSAYWTVMPDPDGSASTEDSLLMRVQLSGSGAAATIGEPEQMYVSHGRMITNPQASAGIVTFVPRVDTGSVYYQLTALNNASGDITNVAILPPSLRVSDAVYCNNGFVFQIEANYDYAKGLNLFGTYCQISDNRYFYINKIPSSPAAYIKQCVFIKSTKNVIGFDVPNNRFFVVETPKDCVDYGDILAASGANQRLVTYTSIINKQNVKKNVTRIRVFE